MNTQRTQDDFRCGTDRDSVIHLKTIQDKTLESVQNETWDQYIDRLIYTGLWYKVVVIDDLVHKETQLVWVNTHQ